MSADYFDCQLTKPFNLSRIAALATEARQTAAFDPLGVGQLSEEALTAIRNSGEQEMPSVATQIRPTMATSKPANEN